MKEEPTKHFSPNKNSKLLRILSIIIFNELNFIHNFEYCSHLLLFLTLLFIIVDSDKREKSYH